MSLDWLPWGPESLLVCGAALGALGSLTIVLGNPIVWPRGNERRYQQMILAGAFCIFLGFVLTIWFYLGKNESDYGKALLVIIIPILTLAVFAAVRFRTNKRKNNRKRNLYEKVKNKAATTGKILFILGFILLFISTILCFIETTAAVVYKVVFPTGLATISLGIGFIAVGEADKSDKRYSELLGRVLHQVENLPYKPGDKVTLPSIPSDYSKEATQKRLDDDTKENMGQPRGELYEVEKGRWAIHWGGKYHL